MFGFGKKKEEPEEEDEFLASLEYAPEATAFANSLLENPYEDEPTITLIWCLDCRCYVGSGHVCPQ